MKKNAKLTTTTTSNRTTLNNDNKLKQTKLTGNYALNSPINYGKRRRKTSLTQNSFNPQFESATLKTLNNNQFPYQKDQLPGKTEKHLNQTQSEDSSTCFPLGIEIDSQCSTLHYHRVHSKEKIKKLNRTHGGWIENSKSQSQSEKNQENLADDGKWTQEELNEVQQDENTNHELSFKIQKNDSDNLISKQNHRHQVLEDDSIIGNPESILPIPTQKNQSGSGAIFFDDSYLEQGNGGPIREEEQAYESHEPIILCPNSFETISHHDDQENDLASPILPSNSHRNPTSPIGFLKADEDDQDQYNESYLDPRTQKLDQSTSFAIFFDSQYVPSKEEKQAILAKDYQQHENENHQTELSIKQTPEKHRLAEDLSMRSIQQNKKARILVEDSQQEKLLKSKILAEDSQDQASPKAHDLANRSLAPPTPISTRTQLLKKSFNSASPPLPLKLEPKIQHGFSKTPIGRFSFPPSSSTTLVYNDQQTVKKGKPDRFATNKDKMADRIMAAWSTPPEFKIVKPDSSKTYRQINLNEFLDPFQSSSSTKMIPKINKSNENEENHDRQVKSIEEKLMYSHLNILNRHRSNQFENNSNQINLGKGKEKDISESEEEEEIDDDDLESCLSGFPGEGKIPDSQLSTASKSSKANANLNDIDNDDKYKDTSDQDDQGLIWRFQDRIDRICIRQSICQNAVDHHQNYYELEGNSPKIQAENIKHHADLENHTIEASALMDDGALVHHAQDAQTLESQSVADPAPAQSKSLFKQLSQKVRDDDDVQVDDKTKTQKIIKAKISKEIEEVKKTNQGEERSSNSNSMLNNHHDSLIHLDNSHPVFALDNLIGISKLILQYESPKHSIS